MHTGASTIWNVGDVILDLYKVTDILGEGGFGTVYKVRHQGWNIDLAVKSPKPEIVVAAGGMESFEREAQTWVNLGLHPHTVSCYYVRRIESSPLVFAEYVAGGSLQDWIESRQLYEGGAGASLKYILDIAIQFAWGLHYAHEQGLIHQDVKPANVMLTPEGVVKVTDFGLAKGRYITARLDLPPTPPYQGGEQKGNSPLYEGMEPQETALLSQGRELQKNSPLFKGGKGGSADGTLLITGNNAMTPAYCSPEQANRETLTRRTDLWSWGLCVLEMFQGGRSWQIGTIAAQALEFYLQGGQEDSQLPQMPDSVAQLLRRCFRENPDERPRDMLDVANEVQGIYQQVTGGAYPRTEPKAGKDIADSLNNRAVSLLDLGRQDEALQLWEQALKVQPQHPEATYNRGLVLWRTGRINDVALVSYLQEVRKSYPGDWVVEYILALVHLERDDCEVAIKILESLQGEGAQQGEIKASLALAKERLPHSRRLLRTLDEQPYLGLSPRSENPFESSNSIYLSADNRFALFADNPLELFRACKSTLKLWEVATGRCLRTFTGHTGAVTSVCLTSWQISARLSADTRPVQKLGFSIDSERVSESFVEVFSQFALSGSSDNTLKLWEVATGCCVRTFEEHTSTVSSVCLSADGRFALFGSRDRTLELWVLKLWVLDWELKDQSPADWDERARPYLETFLTQHIPYTATLPQDRTPSEEEITLALTRCGAPTWTEQDFQNLLYTLGCAGYGWLRPEGVRKQLEAMAGIDTIGANGDHLSNPVIRNWSAGMSSSKLGFYHPDIDKPAPTQCDLYKTQRYEPSAAGSTRAQETQKSRGESPNSQLPIANSQSNQMPVKVALTVIEGKLKGQQFVFNSRTTCIIGRAKDCYLQLPNDADHNTISRYHCLLDINPPDIRVRDFGSLHGTYVNGNLIGQRQPDQSPAEGAQLNFPEYDLKAGDIIKLSNTVFQVSIQVDNQATQTPNLVNTPVFATKIAPEVPKFSEIIKGLLQQANSGESKLVAIRGYTILRELGKGGYGAVYLARHDQTGELVALKIMLPKVAAKPGAIDMFLREIENNKALQHPNLVQLRDYGYDNGTFFFTLEYCNGGSADDLMRQRGGKLSIDEAVPIILQVLDGLQYAHNAEIPYVKRADGTIGKGRGLVHRDLKPHNILLANIDGSCIAKIADYGLAKAFDLAGLSGQTMTGHAAGTPRFMPRQQVLNFKYAKPEVDVWAAAASLYNMLTGAYPRNFGNKDPFLAVLQTNPVPIRQRDASIPQPLAELIDLALVDNPEIHFKNAAAFKRALESVLAWHS